MSILLVIDSLGSGGAQRQLVWLAIGLAQRGYNVALFIYHPSGEHFRGELESQNIEILEVTKQYRLDVRPVIELRKLIKSRQFDFIVSFLDTPNVYAILATLGNSRTRVIVSERFIFPEGRLRFSVWLRYQLYRFADIVTVNSFHQKDRILKHFPWCRHKLNSIWNGVDISTYTPSKSRDSSDPMITRMIAAASVVEWKNAYNLVKAQALAKAEGAKLRIDWAGRVQPTKSSSDEFDRCQKLIHELELDQDWHWLGVVDNMHRIYPKYDALVHPSFKEGLPNAVCEALASGLPVLASEVCDHPLLVENGVNGWLFDPSDPRSIADALLKFVQQSDAERSDMARQSRRIAETKLSMGTFVDEYVRLLLEMR